MNTQIITGILVDVKTKTIKRYDLMYRDLDDINAILGCDFIDVVTRRIGAKTFSIYLDDSGALKDNVPAAISSDYKEVLYGNLFICQNDAGGNLKSLSDLEIEYILQREMTVANVVKGKSYNVIRHSFVGAVL